MRPLFRGRGPTARLYRGFPAGTLVAVLIGSCCAALLAVPGATEAAGVPESAATEGSRAVPGGSDERAEPSGRTARITLMALGTHEDYRLPPGIRVDLVIASPEKRDRRVLAAVRAAHPGAKVFAILNTMDVIPSRWPEPASFWKEHEDWFLHDGNGERVRVRVRQYRGAESRYGMNIAHPGWQEHLGRRVVELLGHGFDGVQLDNVETECSYRLRNIGSWISALPVEMTAEKWPAAEEEMLGRIRAMADEAGFADREIIFNHIRAGEPEVSRRYLARADGANAEEWMSLKVGPSGPWGWASRVDLARSAARSGKRTNLLANASLLSPEEALFSFASYLMAFEGERSTFWYGKAYRAESFPWHWFYDVRLGAPIEEMMLVEGAGIYARRFEAGLVLVNPQESERTMDLDREYLDEALDPVRRVSLRAKEGKILTLPGAEPVSRTVLEVEACMGPQGSAGAAGDTSGFSVGPSRAGSGEVPRRTEPSPGTAPGRTGTPANGESRHGALKLVREERLSGGAAVAFGDTRTACTLVTELPAGRYRLVVEGRGGGRDADAAFVVMGKARRRVAFGFSGRQVFETTLDDPLREVEVVGAEAGVIVDRIVAIRVSDRR